MLFRILDQVKVVVMGTRIDGAPPGEHLQYYEPQVLDEEDEDF